MAAVWSPYSPLIREPNLLIPGKKPVGSVRLASGYVTNRLISAGIVSGPQVYDFATRSIYTATPGVDVQTTAKEGLYLHLNDARDAECVPAPALHTKLDGLSGFTYILRCRFHGTSSADEDSLGLQWTSLQGSIDSPAAARILFRYKSDTKALQLYAAHSSGDVLHAVSADLSDAAWHTLAARLRGGYLDTFLDGDLLSTGTSFPYSLRSDSSAKYPEIMGGHAVTLVAHDSPRFDLSFWYLWGRGLSDAEVVSVSAYPHQFLEPA